MKKVQFTFKSVKPTGKWRSFHPTTHHIKFKKKEVGYIDYESPYKIRFQVIKDDINEDGNPNCVWKWVRLGKDSTSVQEAKNFLNEKIEIILKQFNLYMGE